jgi:murein DD-endopeptidase MepM/ murein hydrolase activator NlpD
LKKGRFTEMLIEENALGKSGFEHWIFCQGMLFNSLDKWWGDHGRRMHPHEGIDLCLYRDRSGKTRRIEKNARIPVMDDGLIKIIINDFLGKTIVMEHETTHGSIERFISFYAHTEPHSSIEVGAFVKEGDIIATLGDTSHSTSNIIPHLHFSVGIPSQTFSYDEFIWNTIRIPEKISLLDPLAVIDWPYKTLDDYNPNCNAL